MREAICNILASAGQANSPIRPTELFNEGWMLRLLLDHLQQSNNTVHPFGLLYGARWYSEALLPSQFCPRHRGDPLCEGPTNADGVVGHFAISDSARGYLTLCVDARQFVVIEAKMFSGLSAGVRRCAVYDQAARNVACIANILALAGKQPDELERLAFFVVAPQSQIDLGIFGDRVTKQSISTMVGNRVAAYGGSKDRWLADWFRPTLERVETGLLSWEQALSGQPSPLHEFYWQCLRFNGPAMSAPHFQPLERTDPAV